MNNKYFFHTLLFTAFFILAGISGSCAYVTGEAVESTVSAVNWVWSADDSGYSVVIDRATRQKIRDVSPEEAFVIIGTSSRLGNPVVIDVRTPAEYAGGHIHRAMNIDVNSTEFRDKINTLDKNVTYVVYCRSGGRSDMARDIMEEMGFRNVINVTGGFSDWEAAGLPVER